MVDIVENMVKHSVKNAMNVDHTFEKMKMQHHHQTTVTDIENKYAKIVKSFFASSNDTDSSANWKSVVTLHAFLLRIDTLLTTDICSATNGTINSDVPSVLRILI